MSEPDVSYQLSPSEMHIAAIIGVQRALHGIKNNKQGRYGCEAQASFDIDIIGAAGELALAKYLDKFWNGSYGDFKAADVGRRFQVRASTYPNGGLILHPADSDSQPFIKIDVRFPMVTLVGWLMGSEGKQGDFWCEPQRGRPCFLVPRDRLHPMSELSARLAA